MMDALFNPQIWISLVTLTLLEIVLGIDNIVFISILAGKLPQESRAKARRAGLAAALVTRLLLLLSLSFIVKLTAPLFALLGHSVSGRDLVLILGGLFLLYKSTTEIHEKVLGEEHEDGSLKAKAKSFGGVIVQIMLLDIIFSLDSVITAVGMVDQLAVMAAAVILAVVIMLFAVGPISHFVETYPTIKMLALSFLLLVGMALVAEGLGLYIPKGYIYFAMFFSMSVEILNIRAGRAKARRKAAR
jgi:predicted tellurium resistance membrane protein TerC